MYTDREICGRTNWDVYGQRNMWQNKWGVKGQRVRWQNKCGGRGTEGEVAEGQRVRWQIA